MLLSVILFRARQGRPLPEGRFELRFERSILVQTVQPIEKARPLKHLGSGLAIERRQVIHAHPAGETCADDGAGTRAADIVEEFVKRSDEILDFPQDAQRQRTNPGSRRRPAPASCVVASPRNAIAGCPTARGASCPSSFTRSDSSGHARDYLHSADVSVEAIRLVFPDLAAHTIHPP